MALLDAEVLRAMMRERALTFDRLSELSGVSPVTVYNGRKGREMRVSTIVKLEKAIKSVEPVSSSLIERR